MRTGSYWPGLLLVCLAPAALAGEGDTRSKGPGEYHELSRLIRQGVLARLPKVYEDQSGWGRTIPIPEGMRLGRRRKVVQVNGRPELPAGTWRKLRVWLNDPDRDLDIQVRELRILGATRYHLALDARAALRTSADIQQWAKGLLLADLDARAEADIGLALEFDITVGLDATRLPPALKVEPKVTDLKMKLNDFTPRQVKFHRLGVVLEGELPPELRDQLRGALQDLMHAAEPAVKEHANKAIAAGLAQDPNVLPPRALLKAAPAPPARD